MKVVSCVASGLLLIASAVAFAGAPQPAPGSFVGNCGVPRTDPGCTVSACEDCVCGGDPYCCGQDQGGIQGGCSTDGGCWDSICTSEAAQFCAAECLVGASPFSGSAPTLSPYGIGASVLLLLGVAYLGFKRAT